MNAEFILDASFMPVTIINNIAMFLQRQKTHLITFSVCITLCIIFQQLFPVVSLQYCPKSMGAVDMRPHCPRPQGEVLAKWTLGHPSAWLSCPEALFIFAPWMLLADWQSLWTPSQCDVFRCVELDYIANIRLTVVKIF